jgi:hypothetical protein
MENSPTSLPLDQVPDDYPKSGWLGPAVAGAFPKAPLVEYEGRFYDEGFTPPKRYYRWKEYERMAHVFVEKCIRNEHGKYAHLTRPEILAQYLERMYKLGWQTPAECRWLIRRTAGLLDWAVPENALESATPS